MSLASTLNTTKSIFNNTAAQSAVVSTNIQNASNPDYNKRSVSTTVDLYSGAIVLTTQRAQNSALLKQALTASTSDSGQQTVLAGMESVLSLLGGTAYSLSPNAYLTTLRDTLQTYSQTPGDITLAQSVVSAAQDVANSLNTMSEGVQSLRLEADAEIANQVGTLNGLLADFKLANDEVIKLTALGADSGNAVDKRESLLKQINQIVGVSTYVTADNSMALYTGSGSVLFETVPRKVSFNPTAGYDAGTQGNDIYIDGVKLDAGSGANTTAKGSLQALLQLRDDVLPTIQTQLDETARATIALFAEKDAGGNPVAGLFTTRDGSAVAFGVNSTIAGLATSITVASAAVASPLKLRDGNINSAAVKQNSGNDAGFSTVLQNYISGFDAARDYDGDARLGTRISLLDFTSDSIGWIEEYRSTATTAAETTNAMLTRATEAYSNSTGVNLDEELILLLDIEQSYKAASKLLATIDEMLRALMEAA